MGIIEFLSLSIGILGIFYAIYSTSLLTKGVKISALLQIRTLIKRMEEDKHKQQVDSPGWMAMHHTQQDLDTLFRSLQKMFNVSDKKAPLV